MTDEGRPRPRQVDENPVGRRADSRRLRPVDDAPLPEKVGGSRRLNVLKPAEAPPPPPTALPPAWLPPKADPSRPSSRRIVADDTPAAAPVVDETPPAPPSLLDRLAAQTGASRRTLIGGAAAVVAVVTVGLVGVGLGGPDVHASRRFDDGAKRTLAATWRREGPAGWGGLHPDRDVVTSVQRIASAVGAGFGANGSIDVIVVAEPASVHGFALPDGAVVLTTGLLWRLTSDAELAAVIAHLHAHQRLGHVAAGLDAPADLAERAAAVLARADAPTPDEVALLVAVAASAATTANAHAFEPDADRAAAAALAASGYDPSALRTVLQRITPPSALSSMHPSSPARDHALTALAAGGRVDAERYRQEVLGRLDRRRGALAQAAPPTAPSTSTSTSTPATPSTSTPSEPPTPATTSPTASPTAATRAPPPGALRPTTKRPTKKPPKPPRRPPR